MSAGRLTNDAVAHELAGTPGWQRDGDAIARTWRVADFKTAMVFVNGVAALAEKANHHPDIAIHWNKVDLTLWTHKIGGLHENDFILAAKVNRLLEDDPDATMAG